MGVGLYLGVLTCLENGQKLYRPQWILLILLSVWQCRSYSTNVKHFEQIVACTFLIVIAIAIHDSKPLQRHDLEPECSSLYVKIRTFHHDFT